MTVSTRDADARVGSGDWGLDGFAARHIGPRAGEIAAMLERLGYASLEEMISATVPASIRLQRELDLPAAASEAEALAELRGLAAQNVVAKSFIGMGYYGTIVPPVILRNVLENPGWYTQYTPYQAEISQGRLEALLNFQTMVADLTGLPLANASLLDEATAAAEAMAMCYSIAGDEGEKNAFFVSTGCHPQTIAVVQARAEAIGVETIVADDVELMDPQCAYLGRLCGVLVQYPATDGRINDYGTLTDKMHAMEALMVVACDLLALTLIKPPGEFGARGADIAVGSAQRFGVPMGYGGPHAAFMATKQEFVRKMPGRLVGVSRDAQGNPAYRLTLQTREQHIRREKATSNICTAQVLLAIMASMYAVWHGAEGLKGIARRVHSLTCRFLKSLTDSDREGDEQMFFASDRFLSFDTMRIYVKEKQELLRIRSDAAAAGINLRAYEDSVGVSFDETSTVEDVRALLRVFGVAEAVTERSDERFGTHLERISHFLTHPVFNSYHSETEMLRYMTRLQSKDLSLAVSMIPLGSCTMKLNATSEMIPITWPEFAELHPFAPREQAKGYHHMFAQLEKWLAEITGFAAVSLQPNAGSQGEYAGLLVIRAWHRSRGEAKRNVCLIPTSAHGTNPASAVTAGFHVVAVACDEQGNVDLQDLNAKAAEHAEKLAAIMLTYPSTHGVFEEGVKEICRVVHEHGGQVYMDGANMNAQVGLTSPAEIGADVCHLNLHKTFCIPHGGGGPGMGPIAVAEHLAAFLPGHPVVSPFEQDGPSPARPAGNACTDGGSTNDPPAEPGAFRAPGAFQAGTHAIGPISAAPWGSAAILPISWMYIRMMGSSGLKQASEVAILNANYIAKRLEGHYPVLYRGAHGLCAHECIIDCRALEESAGVKVEDIAKRLMDYGFHAPTMSWPVPGTLMIEPTESEGKAELDRFCDALIGIREEIRAIEEGRADKQDNLLKGAPHTAAAVSSDAWQHPYPRQQAAYPAPWLKQHKFWPAVGRIDNPYGDRNLVCACPPMTSY